MSPVEAYLDDRGGRKVVMRLQPHILTSEISAPRLHARTVHLELGFSMMAIPFQADCAKCFLQSHMFFLQHRHQQWLAVGALTLLPLPLLACCPWPFSS